MQTDQELMLRVKKGELDCMKLLFERYQSSLIGYFRNKNTSPSDAEDLLQDTFWRMLRYRESYNPRHSFKAWMYQIARNRQYDLIAKNPRAPEAIESVEQSDGSDASQAASSLGRKEEKQLLSVALQKLPEDKREVLVLARFQGLSHREIAEILDCKVSAVKVRLHRALEALRSVFLELNERKTI
jgi:RNA polymerase sigma factor (sigma-70 family)